MKVDKGTPGVLAFFSVLGLLFWVGMTATESSSFDDFCLRIGRHVVFVGMAVVSMAIVVSISILFSKKR